MSKPVSKYTRWGTTLREDEARAVTALLRKCATTRELSQVASSAPVQRALAKFAAMCRRADEKLEARARTANMLRGAK